MLVMTFLCVLSDSITTVLNISVHTLSVSLLMRIFFTCSLITPTPPPIHPITIGITSTHSVSWSSLYNLKGELLILLSFPEHSSHLGKPYLPDVPPFSSCNRLWHQVFYQLTPSSYCTRRLCSSSPVHFLTLLPVPTWLCIRPDIVPSVHSLCTMPPSRSSTDCYAVSCTL